MGARRIQRAMKAQIAPPKVAVEARPYAWAGRARSCGGRRRTAGPVGRTAPPSGRALRVGPAGRPGAGWHGRPGPREAGAGAVGGGAKSTKSSYETNARRTWHIALGLTDIPHTRRTPAPPRAPHPGRERGE